VEESIELSLANQWKIYRRKRIPVVLLSVPSFMTFREGEIFSRGFL
jgi:hypothetical protein